VQLRADQNRSASWPGGRHAHDEEQARDDIAFVQLDDRTARVEVTLFADVYAPAASTW